MNETTNKFRSRNWILGGILVCAVVLAYQQVWHAGFIWDDDDHLTRNPCIVGPQGFKEIWTTSAAVYYPLVLTSFWLQHVLWGLHPLPYHIVNVAVHAACALLLWQVLRRLRIPGAWFGAALWALHPVQAESVAWITELKNTQSCLFYLLTILFFVKWHESETAGRIQVRHYALALFFAALAILSKASTVMLPLALALCAWWLDRQWRWRNLKWLAPFFLISLAASVWTIWEQQFHSGASGPEWQQSWPDRLVLAGKCLWFYLGKLFWPHPLIFIYPRWQLNSSRFISYLPVLAAAAGILVLWWRRNGSARPFFFAAAYFAALLFPVLGFFNVYFYRYSFVGDHFQYLASIGPLALAAAGLTKLSSLFGSKQIFVQNIFCTGLLAIVGMLTWHQGRIYQSTETLWADTLQKNPNCWMAYDNLGSDFIEAGRTDEAVAYFRKSIALNPLSPGAPYNLGKALLQTGQLDEAMVQLRRAIELNPNYAEAYNNLGNAFLELGQNDNAAEAYQKAAKMDPGNADVQYNLGNVSLRLGRVEEAIAYYHKSIELDPHSADSYNNLGYIAQTQGDHRQAIEWYQKATQVHPDDPEIHRNLGNAFFQHGEASTAIEHYRKALRLRPDFAEAQTDLAWALATAPQAQLRNGPDALNLSNHANQLTGGENPLVLHTLAAACAETGRYDEAVQNATKAIELARAAGQPEMVEQFGKELKLYQAGRPFRQETP